MASQPWDYFVPYNADVQIALGNLRPREFQNDDSEMAALSDTELMRSFGTIKPTRRMIEQNMVNAEEDDDLYQNIARGQGFYVIVYLNDRPSEIFFGGYTYD
ncbi:MAG: hypothetical protein ACRYFS_17565 [Janthinobacterium lividum]